MHQILVWDLATRLFHWLLVLFVLICFLTGEDEGFVFAVHAYSGFVVFMLLVFRLGWGVIGSRHSRFSDFVYAWPTVRRFAVSVLHFKPEPYVGHNPLGGWMVILMLMILIATTLTGILMVTTGSEWLDDIHEGLGSFMQVLVLVHIAGVLIDQWMTGEKIVKAMVTGRKELTEDAAELEPQVAGVIRALVFVALVLVGSFYVFQQVNYAAQVASFSTHDDDAAKRKHDND
jgi:cytochrome b